MVAYAFVILYVSVNSHKMRLFIADWGICARVHANATCARPSPFELAAPVVKTTPNSPIAAPVKARALVPCADTDCIASAICTFVCTVSVHVTALRDSLTR